MERMTAERRAEMKAACDDPWWVPSRGHVSQLISELEAVEALYDTHKQMHKAPWCDPNLELDALRAQLAEKEEIIEKSLHAFNCDTNKMVDALREADAANKKLMEIVKKLVAALEYAVGPTRDVKEPQLRAVLAETAEVRKQFNL